MKNRSRRSSLVVLSASFLLVALASEARGQNDTELSPDSNGGGTSFTLGCGRDNVLVGIRASSGLYVDRVQGICSQINNAGEWVGSTFPTANSAGGSGGLTTRDLTCPRGMAVGGLRGRSGQWLDRLEVMCRDISSSGKTVGQFANSPLLKAGSDAANNWGVNACAEVQPANAIRGTSAGYVERIGLSCGQAQVITTFTLTPNPTGGGGPFLGAVSVSKAAQSAPIGIALSSGNAVASLSNPTTIVPPGSIQAIPFSGGTSGVTTSTNVTITVQLREDKVQRILRVDPPTLEALTASPQTGTTGFTSSGTVRLVNAMPVATTVSLRSGNTSLVTVPPSVQITTGQESSSPFSISTASNTTGGCVPVTASLSTGPQKTVTMIVRPAASPAGSPIMVVIPDPPFGATSVTGEIRLSQPAPREGLSVTLTASNSGITVPPFVVVPRDQLMVPFQVRLNGAIGCTTVSASAANTVSRDLVQWNNVGG